MRFKAKTKDYQLIVRAKASFGEEINERELEMLAQKKIRGFMKPQKIRKGVYEYTGPIAVSLSERLKKSITSYDFFLIVEQIIDAVRKAQKNNFLATRMILDINNVYINETTKEVQFIYLPVLNSDKKSDILRFIYSIIYAVQPREEKDADQISRFTYFLKGSSAYNPEKIEKYIINVDPSIVQLINNIQTAHSGFITNKREDFYNHYEKQSDDFDEGTMPLSAIMSSEGDNEGTMPLIEDYEETTPLIEEEEETSLLSENSFIECSVKYPEICRIKTGEKAQINKPVYRIGKERSYVDFFIANNTKISRSHLDIIRRGERYFVKDLGSKNKTYINNRMILPEQENEIFDGDILRLADEEFSFKI